MDYSMKPKSCVFYATSVPFYFFLSFAQHFLFSCLCVVVFVFFSFSLLSLCLYFFFCFKYITFSVCSFLVMLFSVFLLLFLLQWDPYSLLFFFYFFSIRAFLLLFLLHPCFSSFISSPSLLFFFLTNCWRN